MPIDAVTICVHYGDYLAITLPRNRAVLDRVVVVTTEEDRQTRRVCDLHGAECVLTNRLRAGGATFNKGCALNDGLARLSGQGWAAVVDADIVLPLDARELLTDERFDPRVLYSARRRMALDRRMWDAWTASGESLRLPETHHDRRGFARYGPGGTGYFALFHAAAPPLVGRSPWFAEHFPAADGVDIDFAKLWGAWREWLPFDVVHLGPAMQNWNGRRTPAFS